MCQTLLGTSVKEKKCIRHSLSEYTAGTNNLRPTGLRSDDAPLVTQVSGQEVMTESEEVCL